MIYKSFTWSNFNLWIGLSLSKYQIKSSKPAFKLNEQGILYLFNREITTFAFPFAEWNDEIINIIIEKTKIKNIRISKISDDYLPQDRFHIHFNAFYDDYDIYKKLEEYSKNNLENSLFTIVGHSYEFEVKNDWDKIENLLKYLSSNKDIIVTTLEEAINNIY